MARPRSSLAEPGAPEVSVVIPTRDRWSRLPQTLRTVLWQEDVSLEVIVVDDSSTIPPDGTRGLEDPRVVVLRTTRRAGPAPARNVGLAAARAAWVAFLDDDDLWAPRKLRTQIDAAAATGARWVYGAAVQVDADWNVLDPARPPVGPEDVARALLTHSAIPADASNIVVRRSLLLELGGFDERLLHLADWDLCLRLAAAGRPAVCNDVVVAYVVHDANLHLAHANSVLTEFAHLSEKHARAGRRLDGHYLARWVALAHRRAGRRRAAARAYLWGAIAARKPSDLLRAGAALLGERLRRRSSAPAGERPDWLSNYRLELGRTASD